MDDAKLGGVLGPLRVERPCSEIWPNLRAVATCMKKSECGDLQLGGGGRGGGAGVRGWRAALQKGIWVFWLVVATGI